MFRISFFKTLCVLIINDLHEKHSIKASNFEKEDFVQLYGSHLVN